VRYMVIRYFQVSRTKNKYAEHYRLFSDLYDSLENNERDPEHIRSVILKNLHGLPVRCTEAMTLRVLENLPYAEIATRMDVSIKTVEAYITKALAHLRERLRKGIDL
jgi:RNA polymerase sigma factor (sigma-70 family)